MSLFNRKKVEQTSAKEQLPMSNRVTNLSLSQWTWLGDFTHELSFDELVKASKNPIIYKGLNKKSRDLLYYDFVIDSPVDGVNVPEEVEGEIRQFITDKRVINKMQRAVRDGLWSGKNGWIEWICAGNKIPDQPLSGKLVDIQYVATGTFTGYKLNKEGIEVEYWKLAKPIKQDGKEYRYIHASRVESIGFNFEGDNPFSISVIEIARQAIQADNDITKALADNLVMFSHPFPVINTRDNINDKLVDQGWEILNKLKKKELKVGFVGFKDDKFSMLQPNNPTPEEALYHFYIELAASMEMPLMFLIGEQTGHLTGNNVELNDYYKHIASIQHIHISPIFHKMFTLILGEAWKYEIYWNPLFVDEKSETEIKALIMDGIGKLYSTYGVIDLPEARQLLRENNIGIPEQGILDNPDAITTSNPQPEQPIQPQDEQPPPGLKVHKPTIEELDIAKKQHELGEKLIKEGAAK